MIVWNGGNIPAAGTYVYPLEGAPLHAKVVKMTTNFVFGTAGGTTIDNFLQTSFDDGATWHDVANLLVAAASKQGVAIVRKGIASAVITAASDGALPDDTIRDGLFGHHWRVKQIIVGAYHADNTLRLAVNFEEGVNG